MIAELLAVGTELLMGQISNTDAQYLSKRLSEFGVTVYRHTVVGDNPGRVKQALGEALSRSDLVITTGGLGPTEDDLTKEMVAEYFGLEMQLDDASLNALTTRMRLLHPDKEITANNKKQAYFPRGAIIMPNACGTAPGCIVESGAKTVAVLPGPPREMRDMFDKQLAAYLASKTGVQIYSRFMRIFGVGESRVEDILKDLFHLGSPTLALYCSAGEVQARLTVQLPENSDPAPIFDPVEAQIRERLGKAVYGVGRDATMEKSVLEMLLERKKTIAVAESLTGGMLTSMLIDCPGASGAVMQGFVTYANAAKMQLLGVSPATLTTVGAVSEACAREMAEGALGSAQTDYALSTTGIAGPDGGTDDKPVGTVYVGLACASGTQVRAFRFLGDRKWIRTLTCVNALNMLRLKLLEDTL